MTDVTQTDPSLTLTDIQDAIQIIDFAADQGAFRGWDTIQKVFRNRTRLKAFVDAIAPATEAPEEAAPQTTISNPI